MCGRYTKYIVNLLSITQILIFVLKTRFKFKSYKANVLTTSKKNIIQLYIIRNNNNINYKMYKAW